MAPATLMLLNVLITTVPCTAIDKGFRLLFTSNKMSLDNYPVAFHHPRPSWLNGTYIRNGLGQFEMGSRYLNHAFDGYAKLSSFQFINANMTIFTTRFIRTNYFSESKALDSVAPFLLFDSATPPFDATERVKALMNGIDNTNINIYKFTDSKRNLTDFMAVSDFWQGYKFHPVSLKTYKRLDPPVPGGSLFGSMLPLPSSGHPLPEYGTSNHITFVSLMNPVPFLKSKIRIVRIYNAKRRELIGEISVKKVPYMHSFALSKQYAFIFAAPLYIDEMTMLKTARPIDSLDWHPNDPMKIYGVNIKTGKVTESAAPAVFPMHHINSYEVDDNTVVVDYVTYPDIAFMRSLRLDILMKRSSRNKVAVNAKLMRYTFNMKKMSVVTSTFPVKRGLEFVDTLDMPVINERLRNNHYCYIYGVTLKSDNVSFSNASLVKKDLCSSNDLAWNADNQYPSEPWFLPTPGGKSEDDGILLSLVLDGNRKRSYLGIWNATNMVQIDRGQLPFFVPFTLHGRYFDDLV